MDEKSSTLVLKIHLDSHEAQYVKVLQYPFTVGRSIKNSLVLDRQTLSSTHLIIEREEAGIFLSDCGSTNGLYLKGKRIDRIKVDRNLSVFAGGIRIELLVEDEDEDKTQELPLQEFFLKGEHRREIVLKTLKSYLFILVPELFKILLSDPITRDNYEDFLLEIWSMAMVALVLAGAASLFSKIHCKKYQFFPFIWIANGWMGPVSLLTYLPPSIYFYLNMHDWKNFFNMLIPTLLVCFLLYKFSVLLFSQTPRKRLIAVIGTFVLSAGLTKFMMDYYNDRFGNFDYYGAVAYPIRDYGNSAEEYSIKELMTKLDKSFSRVDEYRERLVKKNEKESQE